MLASTFTCPRCRRALQTAAPLPAGQQVVCSACGACFTPVPPTPAPLPNAGALPDWLQPVPAPVRPVVSATAPAPAPLPAPIPPPGEPPRRYLGLLAAVVGGLLLLAGASVLAVHLAAKDDRQERAGGAPPRDAEPPRSATPAPDRPADPPRPTPRGDAPAPAPRRTPPADQPRTPARYDPPALDPVPVKAAPPARPAEPAWLPREDQERVNKAIAKGVEFLKKVQTAAGTWDRGYAVGMAALPGLTLLECGVPATDRSVQKAAAFVREAVPTLNHTYSIGLAVLFLDRLGDPRDRKHIQSLGLRLVAGQTPTGGWTYQCPILTGEEESLLLTALEKTRPSSPLDLFVRGADGKPPGWFVPVGKHREGPPSGGTAEGRPEPAPPAATVPGPAERPAGSTTDRKPASARKAINKLPPRYRNIPALLPPSRSHKLPSRDVGGPSDNSNTQFAVLGLWAAGRHDLPLERALALIVKRFRSSQNRDGSWAYPYLRGGRLGGTPSMTGAGLLGLAVGHGLAVGDTRAVPKKGAVKDRRIEDGLKALGKHIGKNLGAGRVRRGRRGFMSRRSEINLYFLWTLERVGVLYNLRKIAGKDWYAWGAELLVDHQAPDGSWNQGGYPGSTNLVDTCFALLFLKRANLTSDLSRKLEFAIEGKGGP